jgi:formate C-acetyltransferase
MAAAYPSPFEAVCLTGCLTSGLTSAEGGAKYNLFGVNVMGLGTLVDSLYAIKTLVFDRGELTLADLQKDVAASFPDAARLARIRSLPGRYGSDSAETNTLVVGQSRLVTDLILNSRLANGVRPYPAFFRFGGDIGYAGPATPDGRRDGERCSYGVGPGIYTKGASLISILNSAAKVCHDRCGCGNPLTISFNRGDIQGEEGRQRLRQVIETYFRLGGFHLQINVVDANQLRAAKAAPGEHLELTVRISGFSAHFVSLGERWQDAIIERTERGM